MLSAFLASSAKLTGNKNKFQVRAIIISGYLLKEIAFSTSFKSACQMERLACTQLKTDFFQSKTFINNWFFAAEQEMFNNPIFPFTFTTPSISSTPPPFFQFAPTATHAEFPYHHWQLH